MKLKELDTHLAGWFLVVLGIASAIEGEGLEALLFIALGLLVIICFARPKGMRYEIVKAISISIAVLAAIIGFIVVVSRMY